MADVQTVRLATPPQRPEYLRDVVASGNIGVVQKPLTTWERLTNQSWLRKVFILVVIAAAWQAYAVYLNNSLLVPTFVATIQAFYDGLVNGTLPEKIANRIAMSPRTM